jgi:hypothetical protein
MRLVIIASLVTLLMLPSMGQARNTGIGSAQDSTGDGANDITDVAKEGCLCHSTTVTNSVQIILDDVPYSWVAGQSYDLRLQLIGGPEADVGSTTAGFSMRVSAGSLAESDLTQNWEGDIQTLTHNADGARTDARMWPITWTTPESGEGVVDFWITGNSVDGNGLNNGEDSWNQLVIFLLESDEESGLGTRTIFASDGNVSAPEAVEHGVQLHEMGAELRAHWLGLLGFLSVIIVIVFSGLLLRYGFSSSYSGRSNQLRLRYKIRRRGDQ